MPTLLGESESRAPRTSERGTKHTRIIVSHYGGPDELRVVEEERPEPKNGEVRVRVQAAGVSLPDVMMVTGKIVLECRGPGPERKA
ncbi:MAG TPA: hypothetical protein VEI06_07370 [Gemmatimonadaceae bacterium]|nr:hypothetical protein [Gemmatimonadaceae bacterium]